MDRLWFLITLYAFADASMCELRDTCAVCLSVQRYLSSEIKCLKHLKIKRYKQVIINVPVVTYSSGSCACRIFSSKMKASLQELVVIIL